MATEIEVALTREEDVEDIDESREVIPYVYSITAYGADFPVESLVQRVQRGDIVIPTFDPQVTTEAGLPGFQRHFLWSKSQCDRFIESLLLGLPVPEIFLVREPSGVFLVLDGQQRLLTLRAFFDGTLRGKPFVLSDEVQIGFRGRSYDTLDDEDRRRLNDSLIHATIVRQEEPSNDLSSVYLLFERLNTGGTLLQPQEVRVALYRGPFVNLIQSLNENPSWRSLYGRPSQRIKDQELILRFFALYHWSEKYHQPMKEFLNEYMAANKDLALQPESTLGPLFTETVHLIKDQIGDHAFKLRNAINAALLDSVMCGVARRLESGVPFKQLGALRGAYDALLQDGAYLSSISRSTANEESVRTRLRLATKAFSSVG